MGKARKLRRSDPLEHDDPVRVVAHVGGNLDDGTAFNLKGEGGTVIGANPHYRSRHTGERMTTVRLGNGAVVAVPARALKRD